MEEEVIGFFYGANGLAVKEKNIKQGARNMEQVTRKYKLLTSNYQLQIPNFSTLLHRYLQTHAQGFATAHRSAGNTRSGH